MSHERLDGYDWQVLWVMSEGDHMTPSHVAGVTGVDTGKAVSTCGFLRGIGLLRGNEDGYWLSPDGHRALEDAGYFDGGEAVDE
jgi:hypothetical protein